MATIRLYRHRNCAKCARYAWRHRRRDWLGRFVDSTGVSFVGPLRMGEVVVKELRSGETLRGAAGFTRLCRQIPAYWPLLPLLRIPPAAPAHRTRVARLRRRLCDELKSEPAGWHPSFARAPYDSADSDDQPPSYCPC